MTKELPFVSTPTIIEIRGHISTVGTVLLEPCWRHFILRKSLMPSHVSSMLRKVYPASHISMNLRAHCCLRIRFYVELAWYEAFSIFRYLIPISLCITDEMNHGLMSTSTSSLIRLLTYSAESIILSSSSMQSTMVFTTSTLS